MIGYVIRDLAYLKVLYPLMREMVERQEPFYIYYWNNYNRGEKQYNAATETNLKQYHPEIFAWAKQSIPFLTDRQLYEMMSRDRIEKMVSVELCLWVDKKELHNRNIKSYSVQYLTDSMWEGNNEGIDRVYHTTPHIMDCWLKNTNSTYNPDRDRCIGSPIFDALLENAEDIATAVVADLTEEE